MSIWVFFKLLGSLALLMFGMKSMSEALQKMAGPQLRHALGAMTTNRFTGVSRPVLPYPLHYGTCPHQEPDADASHNPTKFSYMTVPAT